MTHRKITTSSVTKKGSSRQWSNISSFLASSFYTKVEGSFGEILFSLDLWTLCYLSAVRGEPIPLTPSTFEPVSFFFFVRNFHRCDVCCFQRQSDATWSRGKTLDSYWSLAERKSKVSRKKRTLTKQDGSTTPRNKLMARNRLDGHGRMSSVDDFGSTSVDHSPSMMQMA